MTKYFASVPRLLGVPNWSLSIEDTDQLTIVGDDVYLLSLVPGSDPDFPEATTVERIELIGTTTTLLETPVTLIERGYIHSGGAFTSARGKVIVYDSTEAWIIDVLGSEGVTVTTWPVTDDPHGVLDILDAGRMTEFRQGGA